MSVERIDRRAYESIDAVNWSTLRYACQSGLHYAYCQSADVPAETDAMRLGRFTHTMVFEPELAGEYVTWEGGDRRGGAWTEFKAANVTHTIILPQQYEAGRAIGEAVRRHPVAGALLASGAAEMTVTWADRSGVKCKGRPDWIGEFALDLKTTKDVEMRAFGRHVASFDYLGQLAFYDLGLKANGAEIPWAFIAAESSPPYDVVVYEVDDDQLWAGEVKVRRALQLVNECRKSRTWPGQYSKAVGLLLPPYAYPTDDETEAAMAVGGEDHAD